MQALTHKPKPFYAKLHNQVIIAIAAAIVIGAVWPDVAVKMKPLGDGFIKLIGMMIAPIVFCIIVSGISGMGSARRVARISVKSMVYFYVVSALALLLGLIAANLIPIGTGLNADTREVINPTTTFVAGKGFAHSIKLNQTFAVNSVQEEITRISDGKVVQSKANGGVQVTPAAMIAGFRLRDAAPLITAWGKGDFVMRIYRGAELLAEGQFTLA